jgi:serine/threonine-protein kinase
MRPNDGRVRAALALAYAGVGRKADAVREAQNGVSLAGPATDAMTGPVRLYDLARVHVAVGDLDAAVAALDEVLSIPSFYSAAWVKLDPDFDALRNHSGYATLLQKHLAR